MKSGRNPSLPKSFFESITAHDAMRISGFDEDFSSNDSYKKNLNNSICYYFDGKGMKIRPKVDAILTKLNEAGVGNCAYVFGESELLTSLMNAEKPLARRITITAR